jgi:hypothetical protein
VTFVGGLCKDEELTLSSCVLHVGIDKPRSKKPVQPCNRRISQALPRVCDAVW